MKLHQLKKGDKFNLQGGLGNTFVVIGISGMPNDVFTMCYKERDGQIQYFAGYIEVNKIA